MTAEALETVLEEYIKKNEYPMGKVMNSLRLALTGAASGLGIAAILGFIGRKEFARRMSYVAERLGRK
jgi:glutamyl-tRNA synthetase